MESVEDFEDVSEGETVSDSPLKSKCKSFINSKAINITWFQFILNNSPGIPHYLNVPSAAEEVIDELQEISYRFLTSYMYTFTP